MKLLKIHNDPDANVCVNRFIRGEWPQINDSTTLTPVRCNFVRAPAVEDVSDISVRRFESTLKEAIMENTGLVINDRSYLLKLVMTFVDTLTTRTIEFESLYVECPNGTRVHELICYDPLTDVVFVKG